MRSFVDDTIYPIYENIIVKGIEASIGRKLVLRTPEENCPIPPPIKKEEDKFFKEIIKKL